MSSIFSGDFRLPESVRPKYHFVKSSMDPDGRPEYRLNMLPDQMVPKHSDLGLFNMSDPKNNVSANKEDRNMHPPGTVFKIQRVAQMESSKKTWYMAADRKFLEPIDEDLAIEQIEKYKKKAEEELTGKSEKASAKTKEAKKKTPASKKDPSELTYLDKLVLKYPKPTVKKDGFYVNEDVWEQLIRNVDRGKNILITGQSGIGKTELVSWLSSSFNKPLKIHDMGATQDPIASLLGVHRIGKDGKSIFDMAAFVQDIQGPNIILMDEVNRAPLNSNNILFPLLDRRRRIDMSIASSEMDREIEAHEGAVFIGTANIGAEFTGTNELDRAFDDRFIPVVIDYPPIRVETGLLVKRTGVKKEDAEKIVSVADRIRKKAQEKDISRTISVRQTLELAEFIADGFELTRAFQFYLKPVFKDEYEEVQDIIQSL